MDTVLRKTVLFISLFVMLTVCVSSALLNSIVAPVQTSSGNPTFSTALFGASREALSAHFLKMADLQFHRGVGYKEVVAFDDSIFQKWQRDMRPSRHEHLHDADVREIVPWFWLSIRANPDNIDTYIIASFWLANECRKPGIAHQILAEARWQIPFSYRIALEDACIFLHEGRFAQAKQMFDAGIAFWPGKDNPDSEDAKLDKTKLLLYRALLHEADGNNDEAISDLQQALVISPSHKELESRIDELKKRNKPVLTASDFWQQLLEKDVKAREHENCSQEETGKDGHKEHDHDD